jgi:hypothetical protein
MFHAQNMAMPLLPGAQQNLYCPYNVHTVCWGYSCAYAYYSWGCHYSICPYGHFSLTPTIVVGPVCPGGASIPAQVGPGDPVEGLQALRRQLEVALAGVRAQEEELRRQRAASGREEGQQQGRGGRGAAAQRSE